MKRFSALLAALLLSACGATVTVPKEVYIPVPVPCEIEQVEQTELPTAPAGSNVAKKAATAMAQILLLKAENERLRAANNNPCPTELPE